MQVTEQKDFISHAVIGGGQTIDFGISNSAEFFNILSSTLYKDQILAVVREVLCNAWDAHIEAGCTDTPVQIQLSSDKFIIKDFGKGIHRDDMGLIYGTYGNSTKKNDGKQTGGFGLGCKAPFAYTDHFEVTSVNDGVKTIYNLSKSSAQAQGKPGIVPIATFPAPNESGLTVSIPVLNENDHRRFRHLIQRIVRNGDMNMTLNGNKIETLGFDNTQASVLITMNSGIIESQPAIMVRYGNVIYPVDKVQEISSMYSQIEAHLTKLSSSGYGNDRKYYIVFQAPPHSIAVTPSRESLSMQGHTIKTLQSLFGDFAQMLRQDFPKVCDEFAVDIVKTAVKEERIPDLLSTAQRLPIVGNELQHFPSTITDLQTMAKRYMQQNYPDDVGFRKRDIQLRVKEMVKAKLLDRGLSQTFLRALDLVQTKGHYNREANEWLQRHVVGRLAGKLIQAGLEVHDRLFAYDPDDQNAPRNGYNIDSTPIVSAARISPKHLFNTIPYLRNIIVIATSNRNLYDRCRKHDVFKKLGDQYGFMYYRVSMRKRDKEEALKLFHASGMQVVDLTVKQPWEIDPRNPSTPTVRKKAKVGVARLDSVKIVNGIYLPNFTHDDAVRITDPEFMVEVSLRNDVPKSSFNYDWGDAATRTIVDLFGEKGGITNNSAIMTKWTGEKGAKQMTNYVQEKVSAYMMTSPTIQEYWAFNIDRVKSAESVDHSSLLHTIYASPTLRAEYGLVNNLTPEDKKYILLWERLLEKFYRYSIMPKSVIQASEHLKKIPLHQANFDLVKKFKGNKLLRVIYDSGLSSIINRAHIEPAEAADAVALLNLILNK